MRGAPSPVATAATADVAPAREFVDPRLDPARRVADQVTLQFNGEDGLEGRLRIAVRGETVRASILSSDTGTLDRLGGQVGVLRKALQEQGFTETRIAVHDTRGASATTPSAARQEARHSDERRQGEPQRRSTQGRDARPDEDSGRKRHEPREGERQQP